MEWTPETYRLDEITRKFDLPCVVCVQEGIYSDTEAESISSGDIIKIDKEIILHKVAANFACDFHTKYEGELPGSDYVDLSEREILVPLNYNGKLKVKTEFKEYASVLELSKVFPRYARLKTNLKVSSAEQGTVEIQAGTVIELDRIIPGESTGKTRAPDNLVIQFERRGSPLFVCVPFNTRGTFRTEQDHNEYTLKETIDRYKLPQIVSFINDELKRVYTTDLVEGIENMRTITETLRLNRLVSQNVLIGHYKPLEGVEEDTGGFCKRTLVVLPIDSPAIREIEVNVLQGATDEDYEAIFFQNVSHDNEIVDGSLYVDFAVGTGIKRLAETKSVEENDSDDAPPPVPRRFCKKTVKPPERGRKEIDTEKLSDDEYIYPDAPKPKVKRPVSQTPMVVVADEGSEATAAAGFFSLADMDFSADFPKESKLHHSKAKIKGMAKTVMSKFRSKAISDSDTQTKPKSRPVLPTPDDDENDDLEDSIYDYPNEDEIEALKKPDEHAYKSPPARLPVHVTDTKKERPVAHVPPQSSETTASEMKDRVKSFSKLNGSELEIRFIACGMPDMAKVCIHNKLDGEFFASLSNEDLQKDPFNLNSFEVKKVERVKKNWIPK